MKGGILVPRYDGTGPNGMGSMTGRGMGYCVVPLDDNANQSQNTKYSSKYASNTNVNQPNMQQQTMNQSDMYEPNMYEYGMRPMAARGFRRGRGCGMGRGRGGRGFGRGW